jgi:hypothetical protein
VSVAMPFTLGQGPADAPAGRGGRAGEIFLNHFPVRTGNR